MKFGRIVPQVNTHRLADWYNIVDRYFSTCLCHSCVLFGVVMSCCRLFIRFHSVGSFAMKPIPQKLSISTVSLYSFFPLIYNAPCQKGLRGYKDSYTIKLSKLSISTVSLYSFFPLIYIAPCQKGLRGYKDSYTTLLISICCRQIEILFHHYTSCIIPVHILAMILWLLLSAAFIYLYFCRCVLSFSLIN